MTTTASDNDSSCVEKGDHRVAVFARMADPHVLATLLSRVLLMRPLDAVVAARNTPGVLPTPMNADQSRRLVAMLHDLGIAAAAIEAAELPDLSMAKTIHHARCLDDGLQLLDLRGSPDELLLWTEIGVVAVGSIPSEPTARYMERGRPSVVSAAPIPEVSRVDTPQHHALELWLLRYDGAQAYRLRHDHFNYESLEGVKTDSATVNFDRFVRDIVGRAGNARHAPSTHAFLAHDLAKYEFQSSDDLEQHALVSWALDRTARQPSDALAAQRIP